MERSRWRNAAAYQIYPRSFYEDREEGETLRGEGSLRGITKKLDYLHDLGVDAIWISPFYPSPMDDGGYDVSNHCDVDPRYGTLADFDEMIAAAHECGIMVMIDLVPNHTSDRHEWFEKSRQGDDKYADWYIWRSPEYDGRPPNNWGSVFSIPQLRARQNGEMPWLREDEPTPPRSAWEFSPERGQFYLHTFATQQPDLNWENPAVREAVKDVMRFWIDRGVDGFRIDAANHTAKNPLLPDEQSNPDYREGIDNPYDQHVRFQSAGYPGTLRRNLLEMTSVLDEFPDRDLRIVFEAYVDNETIHTIDSLSPKASSFYFGRLKNADWDARLHQGLIDEQFARLPEHGIANHVNGNHDKTRLVTRLGKEAARTAALINLTLPGMPFIYQGEEGGFKDVDVPPELRDDLLGERDSVRTPMLWTSGKNAGFSDADRLWLPISPDYATENLEIQRHDPRSSFSLYRALLHMRKASSALREGTYAPLRGDHRDVLTYAVRTKTDQLTVLANFSGQLIETGRIRGTQQALGRIVLSSVSPERGEEVVFDEGATLRPREAVIITGSA